MSVAHDNLPPSRPSRHRRRSHCPVGCRLRSRARAVKLGPLLLAIALAWTAGYSPSDSRRTLITPTGSSTPLNFLRPARDQA